MTEDFPILWTNYYSSLIETEDKIDTIFVKWKYTINRFHAAIQTLNHKDYVCTCIPAIIMSVP